MNQRLENAFDFFEQILPGLYGSDEIRLTQIQMAIHIAGFLSTNSKKRTTLVHAPVGTGKTFAVLIPAVFNLNESNHKIIYSTSSLNLQSQLRNEELKVLQKLGVIEDFIIAKGTTHYLCYKKISQARIPDKIKEALKKFVVLSNEGDRVEFERQYYPLSEDIWGKINLTAQRECRYCQTAEMCPTNNHRKRFNDHKYKIVVTNHNQLIQSVLNHLRNSSPIIDYIRPGGIVIIDEAHDFEDAVLNQLSESLTVNELAKALRTFDPEKRNELSPQVKFLFKELAKLEQKLESNKGRHPVPQACLEVLKNFQKCLHDKLASEVFNLSQRLRSRYEDQESNLEKISELVDRILEIKEHAHWLDLENKSIVVVSRRFKSETRDIINNLTLYNKVIFTSGTLAVDDSFDHVFYSWGGKPPECETVILGTVFDYSKQAIVYVPNNVPKPMSTLSPKFPAYCKALSAEILKLIQITGGRTLILSTSHKQLELLYELLRPELDLLGINFLKQGQKSIELLTEDFKNDEKSVLIGTGSFFAGLSVKHKALISVILCRLPFPPPEDPFLDLIAEGLDQNEKMEMVDYPRMLIRLFQAGGRLIRTIEDFGCFAILDPRVCESSYSDKVISELSNTGYTITRNIDDVRQFINLRFNERGFAKYPDYSRDIIEIPVSLTIPEQIKIGYSTRKTVRPELTGRFITNDQVNFYKSLRKLAGLNTNMINTIKDPYSLFEHLMDLSIKRKLKLSVMEEFPYVSETQKEKFINNFKDKKSRKNSGVKVYYLTPEELERYRNI